MVAWDSVIYGSITLLDLIIFFISVIVVLVIAKIVALYLKRSLSDRIDRDELDKLIKVVQIAIVGIGIWLALPSFDFDVGQLVVIGGTGALIIAFASQKIVGNLGSGMFLLVERPVKIGDTMRIGSTEGTVHQIRVLSTIIKTFEGVYVRIPNESIFNSEITNFVASPARRFEYRVSIAYDADSGAAIAAIRGLLANHPFVLKNPAPSVYVDSLADSGVAIVVRIWAPSKVWWSVRTEMLERIKQLLDGMGIEIPFPQRVITFANTGMKGKQEPGGDNHAAENRG
ncbi:MAG TPA: mechanosensitive ion channel family protein [Methanoregulaceae archaeon]|jgi:small-conductance mechanosensitive channel|nr:mechanosensitive ion channel family protein [Methanoregulaceae archaeon]